MSVVLFLWFQLNFQLIRQEKDGNEINLDLFMSVVLFMVLVKVSAIQKISVQNWAIMEMIYMLILFLCNILESYLWLGNEKLQVQKSFRFRRNILNQLSPIGKILIDYYLNLMSFVKIHPGQTNAIQCSVLCPRIIRRHTYYVSRGARSCTPVFHPQQ